MAAVHTLTRFWLGFDRHVPDVDPVVDHIVRDFLRDFKPSIRVAGGDWQSVDQVSAFDNEQDIDLKDEFEQNERAIDEFGITHYLEGNHEERLRRVGTRLDRRLRSMVDLSGNLHLEDRGIKLLPYHPRLGILRLGHLKVLHGFFATEYLAKKTAGTYGTCAFGHAHRFQVFQSKEAFETHVGFSIGMLGSLEQAYVGNRPPMGWSQGFAFGYIRRDGSFDLYPVRIVGGQAVINNIHYPRPVRSRRRTTGKSKEKK